MTYKFEFDLTEEQVKELEEALQTQQDKYYVKQIECMDMGSSMLEERKKALDNFMAVDDIMQQFNAQALTHKLL